MKTVMGLFEQRTNAEAVAAAAGKAGVPENEIKLLNSAYPADQLVEPGPRNITMKIVRGATVLMILIFGLFGLFAGVGSIYTFGASVGIAAVTVLVFVAIGIFCGLFLGWVMGRSDADSMIQEYREAMEHGNTLVVVKTEKHVKAVEALMRSHGAHWVGVTQQVNRLQTHPQLHSADYAPAAAH
ncbi:MAG: hypothetical protein V9H69_11480 [Anaerolineae bacterium]